MRINVKTTDVILTAELSDYLNKRLASFEKYTSRHNEEAIADVELGITTRHHHSGDIYKAEINIHIGKRAFRALAETNDLFSAIDAAQAQMEDELRSNKDRSIHLVRRGGQKVKEIIKNLNWWRKNK